MATWIFILWIAEKVSLCLFSLNDSKFTQSYYLLFLIVMVIAKFVVANKVEGGRNTQAVPQLNMSSN